jgi:hypothetical protein
MSRQRLKAELAVMVAAIRVDQSWTATDEEWAARLIRGPIDHFLLQAPVQRELAAVRAAASRQRDGYEAEIAALRAGVTV